ncbi:MAG: non-canonical purine NTP diphosphatase [Bacteroidia bacterium]
MQLVFATANKNKAIEVEKLLPAEFDILTLTEVNIREEVPETSPTIEGNALQKARYVYAKSGINCFADDTGLEVEALSGEPGVYSARYAGEKKDPQANMNKLLLKLESQDNRKARFKTIIALIIEGREHLFEGIIDGQIARTQKGSKGFGYDPVFIPEGQDKTFGEMELEEKNLHSHRARAVKKLIAFLNNLAQ